MSVGGIENFNALNETAQANVLKFYEAQGLLYDTQAELERAYGAYLELEEDPSQFNTRMIR